VSEEKTDAEKLALLRAAVIRYLENPGCNMATRKLAMEKLRWAAEQ